MNSVVLTIEGMHCEACVNRVNRALSQVEGLKVSGVEVGRAVVELEGATVEEALAAVRAAGYEASGG